MADHQASEVAVDLRAKSFELSSADQFWLASMVAENVGHVLKRENDEAELPGIAVQRLAEEITKRVAKLAGVEASVIDHTIFRCLADHVGWKLFDKYAEAA